MLENGAEIDAIVDDKKGYTSLMVFCNVKFKMNERESEVNLNIIKFLLENGADKSKKSAKGKDLF